MLLVKTKLKKSPIEGFGVFADENIKKGTVVWKFNPVIDKKITKKQFNSLPKIAKEFLNRYAYSDKNGILVLCGDDARFFNHSKNPTCDDNDEFLTIARRNIRKGEELTSDYRDFDFPRKKDPYV